MPITDPEKKKEHKRLSEAGDKEYLSDKNRNPFLSQSGRLSKLSPEERSRISSLGGKAAKRAHEIKKLTSIVASGKRADILEAATTAMLERNPEAVEKILTNLAKIAEGDSKEAVTASRTLLEITGFTAPKQQEIVIEDKMSEEEAIKILKDAGLH